MSKDFRVLVIGVILAGFGVLSLCLKPVQADSGWEAATRIERGSYINVREVALSTFTGTALFSASKVRPDGICRNNSAFTIWVGTASVTARNDAAHPNVLNGFPVLSSETFKLDGQMTGDVYATASPANTSGVALRCIDGLVR